MEVHVTEYRWKMTKFPPSKTSRDFITIFRQKARERGKTVHGINSTRFISRPLTDISFRNPPAVRKFPKNVYQIYLANLLFKQKKEEKKWRRLWPPNKPWRTIDIFWPVNQRHVKRTLCLGYLWFGRNSCVLLESWCPGNFVKKIWGENIYLLKGRPRRPSGHIQTQFSFSVGKWQDI